MESVIAIATITQTVAWWANILIVCALTGGGAFVSLALLNRTRGVLFQAGMDIIQLYASLENSRLDIAARRQVLTVESEKAKMLLREKRFQLLESLDK